MQQAHGELTIATRGKNLYNITREIASWVAGQNIRSGLLTVFIQHTSASLTIQENADPAVVLDLKDFFERLVPESGKGYRHTAEGPDDMTSHIRSSLTATTLSVPVRGGRPALGTWQGIYLFEHRAVPHRRAVLLHLIGE